MKYGWKDCIENNNTECCMKHCEQNSANKPFNLFYSERLPQRRSFFVYTPVLRLYPISATLNRYYIGYSR